MAEEIAVWFPVVRAGTGVDAFTERLVEALTRRGIRSEVTWLPHRAEYLPWSIRAPRCPAWATVVHVNSWLHTRFVPKQLPSVATVHACVHDPALAPYKSPAQKLYHRHWIRHMERRTVLDATSVTAVSHYTAAQALEHLGRYEIVTVHNWVDIDIFSPGSRERTPDVFRLLFVGNPSRRKGTDLLPEIMRRLGHGYELRYTGKPSDFSEVLPDNMRSLGRIRSTRELVAAYRDSDALLFPTRLEGLPLVVLEALACGLPVVSTRCGSLPEIVEHGVNGLLCELDDTDAFVESIQFLRTSAPVYESMRAAARTSAATRFPEESAVQSYIRIYRQLSASDG